MRFFSQTGSPSDSRSPAEAALLDWAAALLRGDSPVWPLAESDSAMAVAEAFFRRQGVGPLCDLALHETAGAMAPAALRALLRRHRRVQAAADWRRVAEDGEVLGHLATSGLYPLLLKGAAHAHGLYSDSYLRPRCDTDLLFPDRDSAQRAWRRLEGQGYRASSQAVEGRYVSRQKLCFHPGRGHVLDLHWAISNTHTFARALPYDELARAAVALPGLHPAARTLGPVHSLLFGCVHLFGHERIERLSSLLWQYDLFLLGRRLEAADWQDFCRQARAKGLAGTCRQVLEDLQARFPLPACAAILPDLRRAEARESFRPDRLDTPLGYYYQDAKALENWSARLGWLAETLLPAPAYMRQKYPGWSAAWLPLLYLRRLIAGLARRL